MATNSIHKQKVDEMTNKKRRMFFIATVLLLGLLIALGSWILGEFRFFGKMKVAFTFDDGTKDHILYAAPILEKYGYRGIFCIIPEKIGTPGYMSWDDVKELEMRGHEIASHTFHHTNMLALAVAGDMETARSEIHDSKVEIEKSAGVTCKYLAFPYNKCNSYLFDLVRSENLIPLANIRMGIGSNPEESPVGVGERLAVRADRGYGSTVLMFHGIVRGGGVCKFP